MKILLCLASAVLMSSAFANEDGSAAFDYSNNSGQYVITSSSGAKFTTEWSTCGKDKIYAYNYNVKLVGFGASLTSFPADPFAFTKLDWELKAPPITKGAYVVFMNAAGQFLCARVKDVKSRDYDGVSADYLSIDYRIYDDAQSVADVVLENHELAKKNYRAIGADSGSVTYHYQYMDSIFLVEGATGQHFEIMWSGCNYNCMYLYNDNVKAIASASSWTSFPSSTANFSSLDWSERCRKIYENGFFVMENSAGQYLVGRILDVDRSSDNKADHIVSFEYRIYGDGTQTPFDGSDTAPLTVKSSGTTTFTYSSNGGCKTIGSSTVGQFTTKWSTCGRDSLYAYRDKVKLLGVLPSCTAFPATRADLLRFDWELRVESIDEGGYVAFLNSSGQILCAHLKRIQSKSWGAASDSLTLEYQIYAADDVLRDKILGNWSAAQETYRTTGDSGTASFRYTCNGGAFSVFGSQGETFVTKWSLCNASTIYAYRDNVDSVAVGSNWTSFPESSSAFAGLDWSSRVVTVREGGWVVFRNKEGGFLCAKVRDVRAVDRGDTEDKVIFDYRLYAPNSSVPKAVPVNTQAVVDLTSSDSVTMPLPSDGETFTVKLVKTVETASGSRTVDLSDCLDVPRLDNGSLDLSKAEVKPEIVSEVLDPDQGAKMEFSSEKIAIETANTREGLVYEFYESTSLDGLGASPKETKQGDGKPFKPTSGLTGAKSAFFSIKVTK